MNKLTTGVIASIALSLGGCASQQEEGKEISDLRKQYERLADNKDAVRYAPLALADAEAAVVKADNAVENEKHDAHHIYLAERRLEIARERMKAGQAQQVIENADLARSKILLRSREREAHRAKAEAAQYKARAIAAENYAQNMADEASKLLKDLEGINTKTTDRGLVLTLGNILFQVGQAELMDGSERALGRIAQFLKTYPEKSIVIEGHTDASGPDAFNQRLSEQRADAVRAALTSRGIASTKVEIRGLGEDYPVASNETRAGRQQNRRVEIVIENKDKVAIR